MKSIKFHIDEPIMHDSSIEAKKDFHKLLSKMPKAGAESTSLASVWVASVVSCLIFVGGISVYQSINSEVENSDEIRSTTVSLAESESPNETKVKFTLSTPTLEVESPPDTQFSEPENEPTQMLVLNVEEEPVQPKTQVGRDKIQPITSLSLPKVDVNSPTLESESTSFKIPRGLPISVDILTYAELKMADDYYFEIDSSSANQSTHLLRGEWEEAVLRRHPDKNKYRLIINSGKESIEYVVRLVINGNSQSIIQHGRFKLRNLFN